MYLQTFYINLIHCFWFSLFLPVDLSYYLISLLCSVYIYSVLSFFPFVAKHISLYAEGPEN